jgi:hypothetical protein
MPPPRLRRSGSMDSTTELDRRQQRDPQMDNSANTTPSTRRRRQAVPEDSDEDLPEPNTFMQKARILSQRRDAAPKDGAPDESPEPEEGYDLQLNPNGPQPGFSLPHLKAPTKEISVTVSDPSKCIMFSWLLILSRYRHLPTQSRHR